MIKQINKNKMKKKKNNNNNNNNNKSPQQSALKGFPTNAMTINPIFMT